MTITIKKSVKSSNSNIGVVAYLRSDNWDDYNYKTLFHVWIEDEFRNHYEIGDVKIGYLSQTEMSRTEDAFGDSLSSFDESFFSVGQDVSYYENIYSLPQNIRLSFLKAMQDVVHDSRILEKAKNSAVFEISLLRHFKIETIENQFSLALRGEASLTEFNFGYQKPQSNNNAGISLSFTVIPNSLPSTNIHVLIGRNGIGKTTLLNNMISRLTDRSENITSFGDFYDLQSGTRTLNNAYFTNVVSVSFSAFDPFTPPSEVIEKSAPVKYSYIGLKDINPADEVTSVSDDEDTWHSEDYLVRPIARHQDMQDFALVFINSLNACLTFQSKKARWISAITTLESDYNFAEMKLTQFALKPPGKLRDEEAQKIFEKISSGHAVVLLTLTKLVERTEEKTLVIMDEPECHLHPPLLSAFIRAISNLLINRNGVAIIATHSPVILQEVPKNCVWKISRNQMSFSTERPEIETFAENVGTLTRDIFGLEVITSGFHQLLQQEVHSGATYEQIVKKFNGNIGLEGRLMLRALVKNRDRS